MKVSEFTKSCFSFSTMFEDYENQTLCRLVYRKYYFYR